MKYSSNKVMIALTVGLLVTSCSQFGHSNSKKKHQHDKAISLNKKFKADKVLKQSMAQIKKAFGNVSSSKKQSKSKNENFSKIVNQKIEHIAKNCHLSEDADAYLHLSLEKIVDGSEQINRGDVSGGSVLIRDGLHLYERSFN